MAKSQRPVVMDKLSSSECCVRDLEGKNDMGLGPMV
jgi:hypothetical protein